MSDFSHVFGNDLSFNPSGDILMATTTTLTQQRIIRRLLTAMGGYVWQGTYGAGLPAQVGGITSADQIFGIVNAQMQMEGGVDQTQPITTTVTPGDNGAVFLSIAYVDSQTGTREEALVPIS